MSRNKNGKGKAGKRNKQRVVDDRWEKKAETGKVVQDKFMLDRERKAKPIVPKNTKQKLYLDSMKKNQISVGFGASGSGKTFVACSYAANALMLGQIDKIVLVRPYEGCAKSIGLRPGTSEQKLQPIMQSMLDPLEDVLGTGNFNYHLQHGNIVMEALEDVRGRSYRDSFIIVDEASNCNIHTMKTLVTRLGSGSQLVVCGDGVNWQKDIKEKSGLLWFIETVNKLRKNTPDYLDSDDLEELHSNIGMVSFTKDDVVRSGITKLFVKVFDEEG